MDASQTNHAVLTAAIDVFVEWTEATVSDAVTQQQQQQQRTSADPMDMGTAWDSFADRIRKAAEGHESIPANGVHPPAASDDSSAAPFTKRWTEATAANIGRALQRVLPLLADHAHPLTRRAVMKACGRLVRACAKTLSQQMQLFLDLLLGHVQDEDSSVREEAMLQLRHILGNDWTTGSLAGWLNMLQNSVSTLLLALPRQLLSSIAEADKLAHVQRIRGYAVVLGPHMEAVLK